MSNDKQNTENPMEKISQRVAETTIARSDEQGTYVCVQE